MLVVAPEACEYQAIEALAVAPVVLLNCVDPGARLTSVICDEEGAGASAAQLLLDRGHRDVGLIAGPLTHFQTRLRVHGVQRALADAGRPPAQVQISEVRIDAGSASATALLTSRHPPTALVCTSERLAVGALLAAAQLRRSVPQDLSLVSLDDREQLAGQLSPALVRVERPDDLMAAHATGLLIERVESDRVPETQHYSFVCPVATGASVGAPATAG
jgi:LacI family transcriptional regulator